MTAFNPGTYKPGDAWASMEFALRALTPPSLVIPDADAGDATPASYFEYRVARGGEDQVIDVSIHGSDSFSVVMERSFDAGDSWEPVNTYNEPTTELYDYSHPYMLRLRVVSGSGVSIALRQTPQ